MYASPHRATAPCSPALCARTRIQAFDHLLPDGPELVEKVLLVEQDSGCKRNAFLMLFQSDQERAVAFLSDNLDQVAGYGDTLQLVILELIRKVVRSNPLEKSKCALGLLARDPLPPPSHVARTRPRPPRPTSLTHPLTLTARPVARCPAPPPAPSPRAPSPARPAPLSAPTHTRAGHGAGTSGAY